MYVGRLVAITFVLKLWRMTDGAAAVVDASKYDGATMLYILLLHAARLGFHQSYYGRVRRRSTFFCNTPDSKTKLKRDHFPDRRPRNKRYGITVHTLSC